MLMLIITICKRHTWRMQAMAFTQRTINIRTPWHNDTHFLIDKTHTYKTNVCTNTDWDKNTNNVRMSTDLQDTRAIFTKPQIGKTHVFFFLSHKVNVNIFLDKPGGMFANCGRARYNGARMCKAMGRACAKQWGAHAQGIGLRMCKAMACAWRWLV